MIDFGKINSQLDLKNLKNLDVAQLTKILNDHQNSIIKFALIIGSLLIAVGMFNDHRKKDQDLRSQISQAQEKLAAISAHDAAIEAINQFKSSVPSKINEYELIALISNYAKSYHVTITTLSPAESKDMGLYDLINFSFDAESNNFKGMMLFLRNIEKSKYPLRIDSWTGREDDNGKISFTLKISAVLIHT